MKILTSITLLSLFTYINAQGYSDLVPTASAATSAAVVVTTTTTNTTTTLMPTTAYDAILAAQTTACTSMNITTSVLCSPNIFTDLNQVQATSLLCCNIPGAGTSSLCNGASCPTGAFPGLALPTTPATESPAEIGTLAAVSAFYVVHDDRSIIEDCSECATLSASYDTTCGCDTTVAPTTATPITTECPTVTVSCTQSNPATACCTCGECTPTTTYPCSGNTVQYYDVTKTEMASIPYTTTQDTAASTSTSTTSKVQASTSAPTYVYYNSANSITDTIAVVSSIVSLAVVLL